ncbi:TIGR03899 family protein [Colwellia sp. BRX10-3]|uniref:TIGR03899 family protein n=1 Tax=Colwellia sp. BRX10-3 TaxID=2759844 RepID=UPI0015F35E8C|nr:TIGR03899 family protein [Colwellia sp. BRX10-3]MBA6392280.1 TIGR03899 family protein [Colwellia sp. BRX10-3]
MSNISDENKVIEHTGVESKHAVIEHDAKPVASKKSVSANASSQKQLLVLAKNFSLNAAFLPENKQAPLEDRAYRRKKLDELRKQQNMEAIVLRAIQYCSDETITDRADQDWFSSFVTFAEGISNKSMQDLWAKILAGEVSQPGSFSLKTLQTFRTMSITEAKLLAKACSLAMTDTRKKNIRVISGAYQIPKLFNFFNKQRQQRLDLNQVGLSYADILTLADNHLMFEQETESHSLTKGEKIQFNYNGKQVSFVAKKTDCILTFYKFTPIGTELAHLITDNADESYLTAVKTKLAENFAVDG